MATTRSFALRIFNHVLYYLTAASLAAALVLGLIAGPVQAHTGGSDYGQLQISDITCLVNSKQVQIQFILNNVSGGTPGSSVTFTLKLNGGSPQTLSAPFTSQTGGAYHYIYYGTTTGYYDVTGASVSVGTHTVSLHNPDSYSTQNNNCFSTATATPTARPSNTPTATKTAVPTSTFTPTATKTSVPTSTFTPTATNTSVPTSTFTPTATNTSVPTDTFTPTATNTSVPTDTFTPTATDVPTNTPTDVPTSTPTDVPTTVVPPTDTPVPTTETSAPTETPVPTTETAAPTETPVPTTDTVQPTTETPVPTTETAVPTTETPESTKTSPPPVRVLQPISVTLDPVCTVDGRMQWTVENPNNVSFTVTGWSLDGGSEQGGFSAAPGSTKFTTTPLGTHTVTVYYGESQSVSLTDTITVCPLPIPNTGSGLLIPVTGADQTNSLSQAFLFGGLATGGLALILTALRKFLNL